MEISQRMIVHMQDLAREQGKDMSRQEAYEAACNLVGAFKILLEMDMRLNPEMYKVNKED